MRYLILILSFVVAGYSFAYQNEPADFRGIRWNSEIKHHKNLIEVSRSHNGVVYKRTSDKLFLAKAKLESIFYFFTNKKFVYASMTTLGDNNNKELKKALTKMYGKPTSTNEERHELIWQGKKVSIRLDCLPISKKCTALYMLNDYKKHIKNAH